MNRIIAIVLSWALLAPAFAQDVAPDVLVKNVTQEVVELITKDREIKAGSRAKLVEVIEAKVLPHFNFGAMTALAMGQNWGKSTPEQKKRLTEEFKTLLVRTYAGALTQVKDQSVALKPMRSQPTDNEVVVRTEVRGGGEPIQLDYRLEKAADSWKIYDVNVAGVWLVEQYRNSFAQEIGANGVDSLISKLAERNKSAAKPVKG
jgi:phospholipid transport system substrate-binding protein